MRTSGFKAILRRQIQVQQRQEQLTLSKSENRQQDCKAGDTQDSKSSTNSSETLVNSLTLTARPEGLQGSFKLSNPLLCMWCELSLLEELSRGEGKWRICSPVMGWWEDGLEQVSNRLITVPDNKYDPHPCYIKQFSVKFITFYGHQDVNTEVVWQSSTMTSSHRRARIHFQSFLKIMAKKKLQHLKMKVGDLQTLDINPQYPRAQEFQVENKPLLDHSESIQPERLCESDMT